MCILRFAALYGSGDSHEATRIDSQVWIRGHCVVVFVVAMLSIDNAFQPPTRVYIDGRLRNGPFVLQRFLKTNISSSNTRTVHHRRLKRSRRLYQQSLQKDAENHQCSTFWIYVLVRVVLL